jgi:ribosomal protein S24E
MKAEILEQKKNELINRTEAWVGIEHAGMATPGRKEMLPEIAAVLKAKEDHIIIDKIFSDKGRAFSRVKVLAYSKKEDIPPGKLDRMQIRMGLKKAEKAAAKPTEAPKPEAK